MWCFYLMHRLVIEMHGLDNNLNEKPQPNGDADASAVRKVHLLLRIIELIKNVRLYEYSIDVILFQTGCFNSLYKS